MGNARAQTDDWQYEWQYDGRIKENALLENITLEYQIFTTKITMNRFQSVECFESIEKNKQITKK